MASAELTYKGVSQKVYLAPKDFRKRKPVEVLSSQFESQFAGSGILLKDHPLYTYPILIKKEHELCGKCESAAVVCIYFSYYGDLVGKEVSVELYCSDCGWFTQLFYGD